MLVRSTGCMPDVLTRELSGMDLHADTQPASESFALECLLALQLWTQNARNSTDTKTS